MIVKCIEVQFFQRRCTFLTIGKLYDVSNFRNGENLRSEYYILSDSGTYFWYPAFLFVGIADSRDKKLNDILNI